MITSFGSPKTTIPSPTSSPENFREGVVSPSGWPPACVNKYGSFAPAVVAVVVCIENDSIPNGRLSMPTADAGASTPHRIAATTSSVSRRDATGATRTGHGRRRWRGSRPRSSAGHRTEKPPFGHL